jgi:KDO2-lipid IV(A) lauroyltransferase
MIAIVQLLSRLPLSTLQGVGRLLGWIPFLWSRRYRERLRANLAQAGLADARMTRRVVGEIGCGAMELAYIWMRPLPELAGCVREVVGGETIERALRAGRGIVFLTPHLGCFELASLFVGASIPLTVLYRAPRMRWLEPLMQRGRMRGFVKTGSADLSGVRKLMRALKRGEAVGLLPDHVPVAGAGEWADFFGRPAYTGTLAVRLAAATGAPLVMAFCERLSGGRGYRVQFREASVDGSAETAARQINREVEQLIAQQPAQYLWSYNRYKIPRGVAPPGVAPSTAAAAAAADGAFADSQR